MHVPLSRRGIRAGLRALGVILALPFILIAKCEPRDRPRDTVFVLGGQSLALVPGVIGNAARAAYYRHTLARFAPDAAVHFGSYFSKRGARVAEGSGIGAYCVIGLADIGPGVRIASRVSITSGLHHHGDAGGVGGPDRIERVTIGAQSWIGEGALIGADVGARCVVGMGAVVIVPVPDDATVLGNPARQIPAAHKRVSA